MRAYLLLWFEAPLQAWGFDSRFGRRETLDFPTKSGVLGLLLSAMGRGGAETELLARLTPLDMQVVAYECADKYGQPKITPNLRDFHMVGAGYDDTDPWQTLHIPKTAEGKKAVGGGTKITYRQYMQDAAFAVALEVPTDLADGMVRSLQNPNWVIYLGRKNCIPTDIVYRGKFDTADSALAIAADIAQGKSRIETFRVLNGAHEDGERITLNDVPVQFGAHKQYRDRQVTRITPPPPTEHSE